MKSLIRTERFAGLLFVVPLLAYGIGYQLISSLYSDPGH